MSKRLFSHPWLNHAAIIAFFVLLTIMFTLPVVTNITTRIAGTTDAFQMLSSIYSDSWSLASLGLLDGFRLIFTSSTHLFVFHNLFGEPLGYNLFWMFSFVLTGIGTYYLSKHLTKHTIASLAASVIFTFAPIHFALSLGFHGAGHFEWFPLFVLFLIKFLERPSWKYFAGAIAFFLPIPFYDPHNMVSAILIGVIIIGYMIHTNRSILDNTIFRRAAITASLFLILFLAFNYRGLIQVSTSEDNYLKPLLEEVTVYSNDALGFFVPYVYHPFWGNFFWTNLSQEFTRSISESTNYIGIFTLMLACFGILFFYKKSKWVRIWTFAALFFAVMSLGPFLKFAGTIEPKIPAPYLLLYHYIPFFEIVRGVGRFFVVGMLGFAILAAFGVKYILETYNLKKYPLILPMIILLFISVDYLAIPQTSSTKIPQFYHELAKEEGDFSILQIPSATSYEPASKLLYYNTLHNKKIIGEKTFFSRDALDQFPEEKTIPVINNLLFLLPQGIPEDIIQYDYKNIAAAIAQEYDLRYIILHKDFITDNEYIGYGITLENFILTKNFIDSYLPSQEVFQDEDTLVYKLDTTRAAHSSMYVQLGESWSTIGTTAQSVNFRTSKNNAAIKIMNPTNRERALRLTLTLASSDRVRPLSIQRADETIFEGNIYPHQSAVTVYIDEVQTGETVLNISMWEQYTNLSTEQSDINQSNTDAYIILSNVAYEEMQPGNIPDAFTYLAQDTEEFSIIQVAHQDMLLSSKLPRALNAILRKKVLQYRDLQDEPQLLKLLTGNIQWGWKYPDHLQPYDKLYTFAYTTDLLQKHNVKYLVLDKRAFVGERLDDLSLFILNTINAAVEYDDETHRVFRVHYPSQQQNLPQFTFNGKPFGDTHMTFNDPAELFIENSDESSWPMTLKGSVWASPTAQQSVRVMRDGVLQSPPADSLGNHSFELTMPNDTDKNTIEFFSSIPTQDSRQAFSLHSLQLFSSSFDTLSDEFESKLWKMYDAYAIDNESHALSEWSSYNGSIIPSPIAHTGNQSLQIQIDESSSTAGSGAPLARVAKFFNGYTTAASIEAWLYVPVWDETTQIQMRFIYSGEEHNFFTGPRTGFVHTKTLSDTFDHSMPRKTWTKVKLTQTEGGEITLYENDTPLFWCESCGESQILGFWIGIESETPGTKLLVDDIKVARDYFFLK